MESVLDRLEGLRTRQQQFDQLEDSFSPDTRGVTSRSFSAGIDQAQASLQGGLAAGADVLGFDKLNDSLGDAAIENNAQAQDAFSGVVNTLEEAETFGDHVEWAWSSLVSQIPNLAAMAGLGAVTGGAGAVGVRAVASKALSGQIQRVARTKVAQGLTQQAAVRAATKEVTATAAKTGAIGGFTLPSVTMSAGEINNSIARETGQTDQGAKALIAGTAAGLLDTVPLFRVARAAGIAPEVLREGIGAAVKRAGVEAVKQAGTEGATEALQTVIEHAAVDWVDNNIGLFSEQQIDEIVEASAQGALLGFVMGGAGSAISQTRTPAEADPAINDLIDSVESDVPQLIAPKRKSEAERVVRARQNDIRDRATYEAGQGDQGAAANARREIRELERRLEQIKNAAEPETEPGGTPNTDDPVDLPNFDQSDIEQDAPLDPDLEELSTAAEPQLKLAGNNKPWRSERAAERAAKRQNIIDSHDVVETEGGYALQERPPSQLALAADEAATSPNNDLPEPTPAQKEAGNYKVGKARLLGMDVSIENPKGSIRKGQNAQGKTWETEMVAHYGYLKGTEAIDGDHVDVFLSDRAEDETLPIHVVDQIDPETGKYDEPKVMIGYENEAEASEAYLANYDKNWKGLGAITAMDPEKFKEWVQSANAKKPLALPAPDEQSQSLQDAKDRNTWNARKKRKQYADEAAEAQAKLTEDLEQGLQESSDNGFSSTPADAESPAAQLQQEANVATGKTVNAPAEQQIDGGAAANDAPAPRKPTRSEQAKERARKRRKIDTSKDDLLTAISKLGGLNTEVENDFEGRLKQIKMPVGLPALEQKNGKGIDLDTAMESLIEYGYVQPEQIGNGVDHRVLADMLERAAAGEKIYSLEADPSLYIADDARPEDVFDDIEGFLASYPEYESAYLDDQAREQLPSEFYAPDIDRMGEALTEQVVDLVSLGMDKAAVLSLIDDMGNAGDSTSIIMADLHDLAGSLRERQNQQDSDSSSGTPEGDGLLSSYTQEDIESQEKAERDRKQQEADEQNRIKQQDTADDFVLSGSNREADVAASRGQQDLLAEPTPEPIPASLDTPAGLVQTAINNGITKPDDIKAFVRGQNQVAKKLGKPQIEVTDSDISGVESGQSNITDQSDVVADEPRKATAPEHVHNEGKPLNEKEVYQFPKDYAEMPVGQNDLPTPIDPKVFNEIVQPFKQLFGAPDSRSRLEKRPEAKTIITPKDAGKIITSWKDHAAAQSKVGGDGHMNNSQRVVLSLFDKTGEWSQPYRDAGYNVFTFDIQNGQDVMDFSYDYLANEWGYFDGNEIYAVLAACPCTDFAASGNRHHKAKDADGRTEASKQLVFQTLSIIEHLRPSVWALENPVGRIARLTGLPDPRLTFNPNHVGHPYTKKTQLWGSFNAELPMANVDPTEGSKMHKKYGGSSQKTKDARSETPEGFAYSFFMANNWQDTPFITAMSQMFPEAKGAAQAGIDAGMSEDAVYSLVRGSYNFNDSGADARAEMKKAIAELEPDAPVVVSSPQKQAKPEARDAEFLNLAIETQNDIVKEQRKRIKDWKKEADKELSERMINRAESTIKDANDAKRRLRRELRQINGSPAKAKKAADSFGAENTVFTEDAANKALERLRGKLGNVNTGLDPEVIQDGITLAGYYIEGGARSFADYSAKMIDALGESVRPYLRGWYEGVRYYPGFDATGMSSAVEIETGEANASNNSADVERNSRDSSATNEQVQSSVQDGPGPAGQSDGEGGAKAEGRPGKSGDSVSSDSATADGKQSDSSVGSGGRSQSAKRGDAGRGAADSDIGVSPERKGSKTAEKSASERRAKDASSREKQLAVEDVSSVDADLDNIRETLPALLPEQQEDVLFAEQRLLKKDKDGNDQHGVLFTNGTGTGKTYTGLGIVKRMQRKGKDNVLIIVPSDKIAHDWKKSGLDLNLNISSLADTKDKGEGVTITTYANFYQNKELVDRDWDMILADESHKINQNASGKPTSAQDQLRVLSNHPAGRYERSFDKMRKEFAEYNAKVNALTSDVKHLHDTMAAAERDARSQLQPEYYVLEEKRKALQASFDNDPRTKVTFLSATPFAYDFSVDYAEGFLFDYQKLEPGADLAYNSGDARSRFFMTNFGYRMRYNKLTQPEADVDRGMMQRQFNESLKASGALKGRTLKVDADYSREFVTIDGGVGVKIDEGLQFLFDAKTVDEEGNESQKYPLLHQHIIKRFDYLNRMKLLEAIKAKALVPRIKEHHKLGRKVILFHSYNVGGAMHPFNLDDDVALDSDAGKEYQAFSEERPDLVEMDLSGLISPLDQMQNSFEDVMLINGNVKKRDRIANADRFNDDSQPDANLIMLQIDAGKEGISLHDTTGKQQRVYMNLGMPIKPTDSIQAEGRGYRTGQVSNLPMEYFTTGTNFEMYAFADKIASRSSTAENLALGADARDLMNAFVDAFENSSELPPRAEQGTGGKEQDRSREVLTPFERAKTYYFANQKKTSKNKAREGTDYFATPEPLGMKMAEWLGLRPNEKALEPSVGHGAIGRFLPGNTRNTFIEPSNELAAAAKLRIEGKLINSTFENHNIVNKYDGIVMNPPFGSGGSTAIQHLGKAFSHLRNGGRVVALIPEGPAADKKFNKWYESTEGAFKVAEFGLPQVTFTRAGTSVKTRIVVIDKAMTDDDLPAPARSRRDFDADTIKQFFDAIESSSVPERPTIANPEPVGLDYAETVSEPVARTLSDFNMTFDPATRQVTGRGTFKYKKALRYDADGDWDKGAKAWVMPEGTTEESIVRLINIDDSPSQRLGMGPGMSVASVAKVVKRVQRRWKSSPRIVVVNNATEIKNLGETVASNPTLRGLYRRSENTIYVVASNNHSAQDVEQLLLHERQHGQTVNLYGKETVERLSRLAGLIEERAGTLKDFIEERGYEYDYDWYDNYFASEGLSEKQRKGAHLDELLAIMAEDKAGTVGRIRRAAQSVIASIRGWLRNNGFQLLTSLPNDMLINVLRETDRMQFNAPEAASRPIRTLSTTVRQSSEGNNQTINIDDMFSFAEHRETGRIGMKKFGRWIKRNWHTGGLLNNEIQRLKLDADAMKNVGESEVAALVHDFENLMSEAYGVKRYMKVPKSARDNANAYLGGDTSVDLPQNVKESLDTMRAHLDGLSGQMIKAISEMVQLDVEKLTQKQYDELRLFMATDGLQGKIPKRLMKNLNTWNTIKQNIGEYMNRSYQAFDDPGWMEKANRDAGLIGRAEAFIAEQNPDLLPEEVQGAVQAILQDAKESGNFVSFVAKGSKYGGKDTSFLKKRKNVPPVIRELLGENLDPRINYVRSATKMKWYVANHKFLMGVRKAGMGAFLYEKPTGTEFVSKLAGDDSDTMNPLNGVYTSEDLKQGLEDALNKNEASAFVRQIIRINGMVKYGKTILAPTTQVRNFLSASMFTIMNGHFNWKHAVTSFKATKADLFTKDAQWREYLDHLIGLGVLHDNPYAGELKDAIEEFTDVDKYDQGAKAWTRRKADFLQRLYQSGDDFWKMIAFENELTRMKKRGMTLEDAERAAADRVRNGYPTYSMVPRGIQWIRRAYLIGTFVSFPWEIMRTTKNQFGFIRDDWQAGHKKDALQRVSGFAVVAGLAASASFLSAARIGLDDEDDEAVRSLLPSWNRNSQLLYIGYDDNGHPRFLDLSYFDPYTYLKKPITALLNNNNDTVGKKLRDALTEMADPFIGVDIAAGAVMDVIYNKKRDGYGTVYNEADTPVRQAMTISNYLRKSLQPGVVSNIERSVYAINGDVSASGREYKLVDEAFALVGFRTSTLNISQSMIYKSYEFNDAIRNASTIVSRTANTPRNTSTGSVERSVASMQRARQRAFAKMSKLADAAESIGLDRSNINALMKVARISEANRNAILAGKVEPWKMSSRFGKSAAERAAISGLGSDVLQDMEARRRLVGELTNQSQN